MSPVTVKNDVSTPSEEYTNMLKKWQRMDALLGGTDSMRAAGNTYLFQPSGESRLNFEKRLNHLSVLFEQTKNTLEMLVGKVFKKQVKLGAEMNAKLVALSENIDLEGRNLHRFLRKVFYAAFRDRVTFLLAEYTDLTEIKRQIVMREAMESGGEIEGIMARIDNPEDPLTINDIKPYLTEEEVNRYGARPYLVHIDARNVLEYFVEKIDGISTVRRVKIRETIKVDDGAWGTRKVNRIRVLYPGRQEIYTEVTGADGSTEYVLSQVKEISLSKVPVVMICLDMEQEDSFQGRLPLDTIVHLNILHWNSSSTQNKQMEFARRQSLFGRNLEEDKKYTWGGDEIITSNMDNSDLKMVETSGTAIEAGFKHLEILENQMRILAADMLVRRPGNITAREIATDSEAQHSKLGAMVHIFTDSIELAYQYLAEWLGLDPKEAVDSVFINTDFGIEENQFQKLEHATKMRERGDLSRRTYLELARRYEVLDDDHDIEDELELIRMEEESSGNFEFRMNGDAA